MKKMLRNVVFSFEILGETIWEILGENLPVMLEAVIVLLMIVTISVLFTLAILGALILFLNAFA